MIASEDLYQWCEQHSKDCPSFREYFLFFDNIIAAYTLQREAIRKGGHQESHQAGRRHLLWLLFVTNGSHYGPYLLQDIANMEYVWPKEVADCAKKYFSCQNDSGGNQSYDFKQEEVNKTMKSICSAFSKVQLLFACIYQPLWTKVREAITRLTGLKYRGGRSEPTYESDIKEMSRILFKAFSSEEMNGQVVRTIKGEVLEKKYHFESLKEKGTADMLQFAKAYLEGENPTFPRSTLSAPDFG
jgi:hypothetical protein